MNERLGLSGSLLVTAAMCAAAAVPLLAADYRQAYLDGRRALEKGDLAVAARLLAQASSLRPTEVARARLVGAIPEPYLPHHYLAAAYERLARCADALREWDLSASQGAAAALPQVAAEARAGSASCRQRLGLPALADAAAAGRAAPKALVRGLDAFLAGDYAGAVVLLDTVAGGADGLTNAWMLATRGAARQALYRLGGEHDASLLAAAIADLREARRAAPEFRPDPDVFSPRLLELWAAQR